MELTETNETSTTITTLRKDPDRGYHRWSISEIYLGGDIKAGLYVPNVGDVVDDIDATSKIIREKVVISVDETTDIPELADLNREVKNSETENQFAGVGPGYQSETWRIFYDSKVEPHTLMVDTNLHVYGEDATYIKLFKGRDTGTTGTVISQYKAANSSTYSENVPLYQLGTRFDDSTAIKRPRVCHTTEHLEIGEEVTAVVYTASGEQSSSNTFLVAYGSNVRSLDSVTKYITGIELVSPFLSQSDDKLLEFPMNMPVAGLYTAAKVTFTDGTTRNMVIDGKRVVINGLTNYLATKANETAELGLTYYLADDEMAWGTNMGANRHITEIYRYRTLDMDGSYAVHITPVPKWQGSTLGWSLEYYLHNLDRSLSLNVTEYIEQAANSQIFNGKSYGKTQYLAVSLELSTLNIGLSKYRHVQSFELGLNGDPRNYDIPYLLNLHQGDDNRYGEYAKIKVANTMNISTQTLDLNYHSGFANVTAFLAATLYMTHPLYNEYTESKAPTPTHFTVKAPDGTEVEFTIQEWNKELSIPVSSSLNYSDGDTVEVTWLVKEINQSTKYIGITPFICRF